MRHKKPEEQVRSLITYCFGLENEATDAQSLVDDLGADSLDFAQLAMAIEAEFQIEIEDGESDRWLVVGDVIREVERLVTKGN